MQNSPAWLVPLVVGLVIVGVALLVAAVVRSARPGPGPRVARWGRFDEDDLPRFAALPPGSPASEAAATPVPAAGAGARAWRTGGRTTAALAVAGAAALLAGTATTAVAAHREPAGPLSARAVSATLAFGGVVLEPRAVGVTVTYPEVSLRVTGDGTTAQAHVRFPTFNCLTTDPPEDPEAAGCVRSLDEYADLAAPALSVVRTSGGGLRFSGRFPTYTRPNGTPPVATGRVYQLAVAVAPVAKPAGSAAAGGPAVPAQGEAVLAGGRTTTADRAGVNVLRYGD